MWPLSYWTYIIFIIFQVLILLGFKPGVCLVLGEILSVLLQNVASAPMAMDIDEVILPILQLRLPLDGRHEPFLIVKTVPSVGLS